MASSLFSSWKQMIKNILSNSWNNFKIHRTKYIIAVSVLCSLIFIAIMGNGYVEGQMATVYHVKVDEKIVGTTNNRQFIETWLKEQKEQQEKQYKHVTVEFDNEIGFEEEKGFKLTYNNDSVITQLKELITLSSTAVEVKIDGKLVGIAKDQQTMDQLLDAIKSKYAPVTAIAPQSTKDSGVRIAALANTANSTPEVSALSTTEDKKPNIEKVEIKENIEIHKIKVEPSEVLTFEQMKALLEQSATEEKIYHVAEGDCVGCIASKFSMDTKGLLALNPGLSEESILQLDQEIKVAAAQPRLTVQTVEKLTYNEDIPFLVQYVEDKNLPKGQSKTEQEGKMGIKSITAHVTKENGIEIARSITEQKVITDPVVKIVKNGTKIVSRGSGTFGWPTVGGKITSTFGKRWGKQHEGIDIAGVKNRSIKAADNGKIVSAGWDSGYGNCIVIDHGNGYQTRYAHLKSISKKSGTVEKGDVIGVMGNTGDSTGVHLHFEVLKNGKAINPINFLR